MNLIADDRYLEGDDPFVVNDTVQSSKNGSRILWSIVLCAALVIGVAIWAVGRRRDMDS